MTDWQKAIVVIVAIVVSAVTFVEVVRLAANVGIERAKASQAIAEACLKSGMTECKLNTD